MFSFLFVFLAVLQGSRALRYDPAHVGYNLNENKTATNAQDFSGEWAGHTYQKSPDNWRFPFYVLTIDRYINGDPTNDNANGSVFEKNWMTNQFRFGGDVAGLRSDLDYIQGMGIKAIYFTGSMMLNMPWSPDGYGPLDFTLLDRHHGNIDEWRALTTEIHARDMYLIFDHTVSTMANLLGFGGKYLNATVEFNFNEYDAVWKQPDRRYHDFLPGNERDPDCKMPRIWEQDGYLLPQNVSDKYNGCRDSEFDMYGDIESTGAYPSYINQFSRFASVQDRLREWRPDVLAKINNMACLQIAMLDIDGYRIDKAVQVTIDALASFSTYQRECARLLGKDNFLVVGEIVADPKLSAVYVGRGKQPDQELDDKSLAVFTNNETDASTFIRPFGETALDAAAFHYDIYGSMTRFLGLDGPWGSLGVDWVQLWNKMLTSHDMVNANTGLFDPRHMFGTTNQDVFRWPALANGTHRQLLGLFVTTLELPGVPMIFYGEEQEYYVLENLAPDYVFGRTPFGSSPAWQLHGCYGLGQELYVDMPYNSSGQGCHDDSMSLDKRDASRPFRNIIKRMFELRQQYPVLNDGYELQTLSTHLYNIYLPGSQGMPTPHGVWSILRSRNTDVQDLSGTGHGNQSVWELFHNEPDTITYKFDCTSNNSTALDGALISAFPTGTTIKNLFYPYEEHTLISSTFTYGFENSAKAQGCLSTLDFRPYEFKAFVPLAEWEQPKPVITHVFPRHDARVTSTVAYDKTESIKIEIGFSSPMDCDSVRDSLLIESTTELGVVASLKESTIKCKTVDLPADPPGYIGEVPSNWLFTAELENVANGIHTYTVDNPAAQNATTNGTLSTKTRDRFMFRIGQSDNPMVFPSTSNYTRGLLNEDPTTGALYVSPKAAGAEKMRYSTNFGSSFSDWQNYTGGNITIEKQSWSGTKAQRWDGEHVILHFWSKMAGSSDHVQHSDIGREDQPPRRWPHAWAEGVWNQWGSDAGLSNKLEQNDAGEWTFNLFTEWPTNIMINIWGMNPDGQLDKSAAYGDVDRDGVLDWVPPDSLANNVINISAAPAHGYLGYKIVVNDGNWGYTLVPHGSASAQTILLVLLCIIPVITAIFGVWAFRASFYKVKFNKIGSSGEPKSIFPFSTAFPLLETFKWGRKDKSEYAPSPNLGVSENLSTAGAGEAGALAVSAGSPGRRTILIATMEYEIAEWAIKIKIGGLGVMASLMGKNLTHQNLIWVIPCVGGIDYPYGPDEQADYMQVGISGQEYDVTVHYHVVNNITYVLLDAPIFRKRTKAEPYPPRMDDLESGIYYSTWNQCIAETVRRFQPDLYHINDYHGAAAPLYLLPGTIPCCLSLHNAEFQGMWPLKTTQQIQEICGVFNLEEEVVRRYVQFGDVFNLLHAAVRYLHIHQAGFGAVGVSKKYGKRSLARYPIFWCLDKIGSLPNPDPGDVAPFDKNAKLPEAQVDPVKEEQRAIFRVQAQEWAGLNVDPKAELFIFVGRWSEQKGIDLIADVFPSVLEKRPNTQLICVGPVIDLYGRFAALKLEKLMIQYPGRVYSKPEFTALPAFIFTGAEFALMPSRDEPFGLVAVEFGCKGAICIGSRVGGFGNMPGWWFTVESVTSKHMISQFKSAISAALASDQETRALMRAYSVIQRFPVAQWVEDLEKLQSTSIHMAFKTKAEPTLFTKLSAMSSKVSLALPGSSSATPSGAVTPTNGRTLGPNSSQIFGLSVGGNSGTSTPRPNHLTSPVGSFNGGLPGSSSPRPGMHSPAGSFGGFPHSPGQGLHSPAGSFGGSSGFNTPRDSPGSVYNGFPSGLESGRNTPTRRLSIGEISMTQSEYSIQQNPAPLFTDANNKYYNSFSQKLDKLAGKPSNGKNTIEEYIVDSEREWFNNYHLASMSTSSLLTSKKEKSNEKKYPAAKRQSLAEFDEYLGNGYEAPSGIKHLLQKKIGTWFVYSFLLAFGQILSASSLQLTLLVGAVGEPPEKLYILSCIYAVSSLMWWYLFRRVCAVWVLSMPFAFIGACFFLLGMAIAAKEAFAKGWVYNVATGLYTIGSSAGSLYFTLNFGTEGGTPPQAWAFRACVITGTQQLIIAFLWFWGSALTKSSMPGDEKTTYTPSSGVLTGVTIPLAFLMWAIGAALFYGLPDYYRQKPGAVPSFYSAVSRKGVVLWFWTMVILQGYWLSPNLSRNWMFLWSSRHAPAWAIVLLILLFFVVIWAGLLAVLGHLTKAHSWLIPIFAIGLGAPGWCQMLWGISAIGEHIPWLGAVSGALFSRSVWLWLGVLHSIQDVGFGMILLQTLTRVHITFVFTMAQVIGAIITIIARASAPNKLGPAGVFHNFGNGLVPGVSFWICLVCQVVVCVGYFKFFRKAQLNKP
ncbi:glycosyl transferase group 1 [Phlyctema vagabunda]|uniref:alpha-1,3-glucan synthase n=1 Tax=Phlyctema vagabunda TaxID=108571 RepID=A0ABR4PPF2_9HELO